MRVLDRVLVRDLLHMKGQVIAVCLVIACGTATFVLSLSTLRSMRTTQAEYYQRYRFADVFAHLRRAPRSLVKRVEEIPGVARVQSRIVADVSLDVEGMSEPATGRLVSVPESGPPGINSLYLRRGRMIERGAATEVLVSEGFAEAHGFGPGDHVRAVINGRRRSLVIVGVALSPEYIYLIQPGALLPDDRRYGVFWMGEKELAAAYDMEGAFNDLALTLAPGASQADVILRLDRLLDRYGGLAAYGREEQLSNKYVSDEIRQLRGMALVPPAIFLAVAAFLLNIVLSRLVHTQREQIATFKAFGYRRREVGLHYLKMVLVVVVLGVGLGTAVGARLGLALTRMYTDFFRFPVFRYRLDPGVVLWALAVTSGAAVLGVFHSVVRAVALQPAQAMRPEAPAEYHPTLAERAGLQRLLPPAARMVLRNLERRPLRAVLSSIGVSLAVGVLVLGSFTEDTIDYVIAFEFERAQRQDLQVAFTDPLSSSAVHALAEMPGVRRVEPFRSVAARIRSGHRSRRVSVLGLVRSPDLFRVLDFQGRATVLPEDGVVLNDALAKILGVRPGDEVTVEVLEGRRPRLRVPVAGIVEQFQGLAAYMSLDALDRRLREGDLVSGAFLSTDAASLDPLYARLKETPKVAGVGVKEAAIRSFRETLAETLLKMKAFNVAFAAIIAFGVVYNSARISLAERSRELATLRVIGFTRGEVSRVLLGELALIVLVSLPLGVAAGYGFSALAALSYQSETYRFPLIVDPSTYAFAVVVILLAAAISGALVRERVDRLDLLSALKARD